MWSHPSHYDSGGLLNSDGKPEVVTGQWLTVLFGSKISKPGTAAWPSSGCLMGASHTQHSRLALFIGMSQYPNGSLCCNIHKVHFPLQYVKTPLPAYSSNSRNYSCAADLPFAGYRHTYAKHARRLSAIQTHARGLSAIHTHVLSAEHTGYPWGAVVRVVLAAYPCWPSPRLIRPSGITTHVIVLVG
jgi:hypothetical protein